MKLSYKKVSQMNINNYIIYNTTVCFMDEMVAYFILEPATVVRVHTHKNINLLFPQLIFKTYKPFALRGLAQ